MKTVDYNGLIMDNLSELRKLQHAKYMTQRKHEELENEKILKKRKLSYKLDNLICLNKEKLCAVRITRWIKRHLPVLDYIDKDVPGLYLVRFKFTDINSKHPLTYSNPDHDMTNLDPETISMNLAIIESLREERSYDVDEYGFVIEKPKEDIGMYVGLDLRKIGPHPDKPIKVYGETFWLDVKQRQYVRKLWHLLNGQSIKSQAYLQDIALQKSICVDRKK